jgi:hypothetical protein
MRVAWLAIAVSLLLALPLAAAELLFHASFDDGIDARVARGSPTGSYSAAPGQPDKPVFVPGICGRAVDFGSSGASVTFEGKENLRNDRGTVTFWARRIGPKPPEQGAGHTYTYHLGGWRGEDANWVLFYRWEWYATLCFLHGVRGQSDVGIFLPIDGDDGEWHFYAFTWDGQVARAYVDGHSAANMEKKDYPPTRVQSFYVGGGDATGRAIDEVRIFDAALGRSDVRRMYHEFAGPDTAPFVVVPRLPAPIRVDGKVEAPEWAGAVRTAGFSDLQAKLAAATPTWLWLAYDDAALYVALATPLPEKTRSNLAMTAGITGVLKQSITQFDANVDADDAFELNLVPDPAEGTWYRLVVNGINTHYDYSVSTAGVTVLGWDPKWESASTVDSDGWHAEIRVSFAGLGIPPPKPGAEWGFNAFRIWQALQHGKDAWHLAGRPPEGKPYPVGRVRFAEAATPIVRLADWGPVSDNLVALAGEVANPSQTAAGVEVALSSATGELNQAQALEVPPGGASRFSFAGKVQDPQTAMLTLTVSAAGQQPLLFRSQVPVMVRDVLDLQTFHYPSAGLFRIALNAGSLRDVPLADLALRTQVLDAAGREAMPPTTTAPLPAYVFDQEFRTQPLAAGTFNVQCTVEQAGKTIAEKAFPFEKQELPAWYGNTVGATTAAPPPFTPLVRTGQTIACWGREYRFGRSLFPEQILTQGNELLAGPIELILEDDQGRRQEPSRKAAAKWGRHTDFRLEFARALELDGVKVRSENWLECDGLLWTTLQLESRKTRIGKLVVRVPFRKEWSEYINTYDYSVQNTGRLKSTGWQSKDIPIWLGNATGGLQWLTETLAPCRLGKDTPPVRVTVLPEMNLFELTLIDQPTDIGEPFSVSWGWIATPVRPPTPGYRGWVTRSSEYYPHYVWYYPESSTFDPRWERTEHAGRSLFLGTNPRGDGRGEELVSGGPYIVTGQCATQVPEARYWADEWSPSRFGRIIEAGYGAEYAVVSPGSASWADYLVWTYRQTYGRQRYIGLYYDCAMYMPDDNLHHGCGHRTTEGAILPVNCVLGARRIAQRLYCMLRELEPKQTMVMCHHSGMINLAVLSWCDVFADGENFASRLNKQEIDYHRVFPPDAFLAQSMGHNLGLTVWFLDQFTRSRAVDPADWKTLGFQPTTHLYGLILLHDSGYWKSYGYPEAWKAVDAALLKYHFDDEYRMIPYWNQKIVPLPEKVFATFYRNERTGTVLLILLNNNEEDQQLALRLDWQALGFGDPAAVQVDDPVCGGQPAVETLAEPLRIPVGVEPDPPVSRNWRDDFHVARPVGVEPDPPVSRNWRDDFHVVRRGSARASVVNGELVTPVGLADMRLLALTPGK